MSVAIANIQSKGLVLGPGIQLRAAQIGFCTPMRNSPMQVTIPIKWTDYGANSATPILIDVDLNSLGSANPLDALRSVYIDNTFSPTPVYVIFPDTQYVIVVPPYSVVLSPVWTNGTKIQLFGTAWTDNDIPSTVFSFSNVNISSLAVISAPLVEAKKTILLSSHTFLSGGGVVQSFNNMALGPAFPSRRLICVVHAQAAAAITVVSAVATTGGFGGVNSRIDAISTDTFTTTSIRTPFNNNVTATTISIDVTFSIAPRSCSMEIYSAYNLTGAGLPYDVEGPVGSAQNILLKTPKNGVAVYGGSSNPAAGGAPVLGIENSFDFQEGAGATRLISGTGYQHTDGSDLPIFTNLVSNTLSSCAASFT